MNAHFARAKVKPVVEFKKNHPDARLPEYAHPGQDSGMDLFALEEITIPPDSWELVSTGLSMSLPRGHEGQIRSKSGLALSQGLSVLNSPGTIDFGYTGELGVILKNHGMSYVMVAKGQKIAQLVIAPVTHAHLVEVTSLGSSDRGEGGFGSTGLE